MNIQITERARKEIEKRIQDRQGFLKLYYDIEDCGCSGGVPALQYVKEINQDQDLIVETEYGTVLVEESQKIFFDEEVTIDFSEVMNLFQLKSPVGILNPVMQLELLD